MTEVLEITDLTVSIPDIDQAPVDKVSLTVTKGQTLGIVGESGCGKSLTMMAILGLAGRSMRVKGSVRLNGEELIGKSDYEMSRIRGRRIGMIFQNPLTCLNPVLTVGRHLAEALKLHQPELSTKAITRRSLELLDLVAVPFPEKRLQQYPHELSGGMRQRIMIAIAMCNDPELLIADEPTTALDVTIQAQILQILEDLQKTYGLAIVLISHDLGVIAEAANRMAVMYGGRICEQGDVRHVLGAPKHPYTRALLETIPRLTGPIGTLLSIPGSLPPIGLRPSGCCFHPRCSFALDDCKRQNPELRHVQTQLVACHNPMEVNFEGVGG